MGLVLVLVFVLLRLNVILWFWQPKPAEKKSRKERERGRERGEERQRNQAKRRAVSAIDMLDRQRTTWDDEGQTNLQSGFRYALSGIRNRIRLRIRLSKPIVGPCKCQACVSFHMPAASYPALSPPLSRSLPLFLSFSLSVCFMRYELHKFPDRVFFMDLFLFIIMLCVWCVYVCVCDVRVCNVRVWCVCVCERFCVWLCRYNIIIKRIAKVCP